MYTVSAGFGMVDGFSISFLMVMVMFCRFFAAVISISLMGVSDFDRSSFFVSFLAILFIMLLISISFSTMVNDHVLVALFPALSDTSSLIVCVV